MTTLRLVSICAVLILLVCACSPEEPTPTNAPPVEAAISTEVMTYTPTRDYALTITAVSWTATPYPTLTPRWTYTPTPAGRWGVYTESNFDPGFVNPAYWSDPLPATWRNPSPETARYQLSITDATTVLERCEYGSNRMVVRRQINAEAALIDLESGETLGETTFEGDRPDGCVPVVEFAPDDLVKYWDGHVVRQEVIMAWVLATLPDSSPGLVTLTPTPTSTRTPTMVPTDARLATLDTIAHNADWEPDLQTFDGVAMMKVPAGCFIMGSPERESSQPMHTVCLDSFWIDRTEVTNAQFRTFHGQAEEASSQTGPQQPRNEITWAEASQFCASRGGRLPTEAEWEFAARGPDGWLYPWGDEFVVGRVAGATDPVGSQPTGASWVGALDLSGSMSEWVGDWSGPYSPEPQINPSGPESGDLRVRRGGSWMDNDTFLLSGVTRQAWNPDARDPLIGFRCVRPVED